jgi:hypothetical protein
MGEGATQFIRLIALLAALCLLAAGSAEAAKRRASGGGTHVYLLRGIWNVSVGLDALAAKLQRRGYRTSVYGHTDATAVTQQMLGDYRSGRVRTIVMVGHSLGAAAAVQIAGHLARENVPVALIVSLDPYAAGTVPANVRRVVNFHVGSAELAATGDFRGALRNLNLGGEEGMDHMTIQATDAMHRRIMGAIGAR